MMEAADLQEPRGTLVADMPSRESLLHSLLMRSVSVAFARFRADGTLLEANDRFKGLVGEAPADVRLQDVVSEGQREEVASLLREHRKPDPGYMMHIASGIEMPVTLEVVWEWDGDELFFLGDVRVEEMESAQTDLIKLHNRALALARDNIKKSAELGRILAALERAQHMEDSGGRHDH
jgi:hypothetical protein